MQALEFSLIVLACVIGSAVACQVVRRLSLPLVQIAVGAVVALVVPAVHEVDIPSELFLVLFIAPLLFDEARSTDPRQLWENKGSILSLAVGLVLLTVLVVGFVLHWFVPSVPLAAAFACAAALAPTDAAAVGALGATVSLKKRQRTLLSGESLINDASGVVAFQFASAAALTGAFSAAQAGEEFLVLFFGGIGVGAVVGAAGLFSMRLLRRGGYESTTVHVLYEVFSPFFVFLFAEWLHTSGILAVVAAGLVMADRPQRLTSTAAAQRQLVSNGFWRVLVFLINSVVFILLGMQLPQAFMPALADHFSLPFLLGIVALTTALVVVCRFLWVLVMEAVYRLRLRRHRGHKVRRRGSRLEVVEPKIRRKSAKAPARPAAGATVRAAGAPETAKDVPVPDAGDVKGAAVLSPTPHLRTKRPHWKERIGSLLRNALVLTVGGPKGAVTLSIIFTLPTVMSDGTTPFPERDLLIFLTASVILCTLLLADVLLPRLAPSEGSANTEADVRRGTIMVLDATVRELQSMLASDENPHYDPALRATLSHYRVRLAREREAQDDQCSRYLEELAAEVREAQERKADLVRQQEGFEMADPARTYAMLRRVRQSVGYQGADANVGARSSTLRGRAALLWQRTKPSDLGDEQAERLYYESCLFAIELEHAAIDSLETVVAADDGRRHAAEVLLREHRAVLDSLWNRINYGQEVKQADHTGLLAEAPPALPEGMEPLFGKQLTEAARYADEVDADALSIELDQIRHLQEHGQITPAVARTLRQRVYVLQMSLGE